MSLEVNKLWREEQNFTYGGTEEEPCAQIHEVGEVIKSEFPPFGNYFRIHARALSVTSFQSYSELSIVDGGFGVPGFLKRIPDGTVILEALAEVGCSGLEQIVYHYEREVYDCEGIEITPAVETTDESVGSMDYFVAGMTEDGYEVIGSVGGAKDGTSVVDFTGIINSILADRPIGRYWRGYVIVPNPGLAVAVPGEGPTRTREACPGESCPGTRIEYYTEDSTLVKWSALSINDIIVKVQYPDSDKTRTIIIPRLPSQKALADIIPEPV